jgi:hypothetical protein
VADARGVVLIVVALIGAAGMVIAALIPALIAHSDGQPTTPPAAPTTTPSIQQETAKSEPPAPVPAPRTPAPTAPQPHPVRVEATRQWKDTKISVTDGERLTITATGEVVSNIHARERPVGPDGHRGRPDFSKFNVLREYNHAALIGRIDGVDGDTGKLFYIGLAVNDLPVDRSGVLFLGVNDIDVKNNSGEFIVNVVVAP